MDSPFHPSRQSSSNFNNHNNFAFPAEPPQSRGHAVLSQSPFQNASPPRRAPVTTTSTSSTSPESRRPAAHAHRRSNSLTGMNQGVGNLNRWSKSSVSSAGSTQPTHKRSNSARRVSLSGSTTFLLGADTTSPPRKLHKHRPSTAISPQSQFARSNLDSTLTLPPILTLPSLQTSVNNSSPLTGPTTPSPSTAAILSAAVRTTVPDYFGRAWDESAPRGFAANIDPAAAVSLDVENDKPPVGERLRSRKGHSRSSDQPGKGSSSTNSNGNFKQPSQKAMLSKALQKANTAVLLDNAQNFEGAMHAYSEACALLQQVMIRSSGDEDRRKLEAIRNTYTSRISELKKITPELLDDGSKALPQRPESEGRRVEELTLQDEDEEPAIIETATVTRIVNDQSYITEPDQARSVPTSHLPARRESLLPSALGSMPYRGNSAFSEYDRSQSKSPMKMRIKETNSNLAPPMESLYMPPPLSPRRPTSPMNHAPQTNHTRQHSSDLYTQTDPGASPSRGHTRAPSNESMSWLDTIDESSGSTASSVHSRTSSLGVRRKRIRAASGATEAEFDAALDAAVEAAYDDGFEPMGGSAVNRFDYDDDDEIVANVRRKVELAKERVRQSEREAAIQDARDRERKRLLLQEQAPQNTFEDEYDNESEEEERMLEEMTREYVMDDFEFGLQSKSALPRGSDSSEFSGRTWNSSIGSNPTTAGTTLSTVAETSIPKLPILQPSNSNSNSIHPPPAQALPPPPPPNPAPQPIAITSKGVRSRRLSGQNAKLLKIETTSKTSNGALTQPPSMPPPKVPESSSVPIQPKTAGFPQQRPAAASISGRPPIPQVIRQASSPLPGPHPADIQAPPTPTLTQFTQLTQTSTNETDVLPPSPARAQSRAGIRKNFSSSSLKTMKGRNLSVSVIDDGSDISPNTPNSSFNSRDMNGRLPAVPTLPTPISAAFKDKGAPSGGLYLFDSDIHSPNSPGSPNPLSAGAPIPLEPCPTEFLLRPFWLMRALYQTIAHPRGGYLSTKLFVPRDVWRVKGVKLRNVEDKILSCDYLTAALMKLAKVDTFDADAVLEEMQSLEGILEQVQATLTKKLGNEVGVQGSGGMFKDAPPNGDAETSTTAPKSGSMSSKSSSFSWRRLRSKNSGVGLSNAYSSKTTPTDLPKEGLTMSTLPMTTTSVAKVRFAKRDVSEVQFSGPNANYMGALARLFDAAQTLDQIARQVEDPGLRHADKTQVGLELCTRHAAEFFGFYICRFVLTDIGLLLDKFIKRGSEWVLV
ncbi:hypothetical protein LHYA1_G000538 [Lachnellula hyalina]|uniref:MIT domain-containing protein n=1 Tax=Lachnellula hyalina TaxID=1316788 RepID=A0A8H8RBV8_9HELO|nr:uncharacterized protein LHYA1_G000538 [Lachnellula hyalina]TVY30501.1 hypothetical protein LHYA1_G000538 [Lachnellula hyalina]